MRRTFFRSVFFAALAAVSVNGLNGLAARPALAGGGGGGGGGGHKALTFSGSLSAIDYSSGAITSTTTVYYNPNRVFYIRSTTAVTLNGRPATITDLKVGDAVTISVDDRSVDASTVKATRR